MWVANLGAALTKANEFKSHKSVIRLTEVRKVTNFDEDLARKILDDKEKTLAIWQNGTIMIDGVTLCCGYDFAEDAFSKKINIGYCPICGRKIVIKKPMNE